MKAIIYQTYGSPDVLRLADIDKPTASADQVLVKIRAASANPLDWHFMRGLPYFVRIMAGLRKPQFTQLGVDVAGRVEKGQLGLIPPRVVLVLCAGGLDGEFVRPVRE